MTALLVAAVLPLGAEMASRDQDSFRFATVSLARQITAAAEEIALGFGKSTHVAGLSA